LNKTTKPKSQTTHFLKIKLKKKTNLKKATEKKDLSQPW